MIFSLQFLNTRRGRSELVWMPTRIQGICEIPVRSYCGETSCDKTVLIWLCWLGGFQSVFWKILKSLGSLSEVFTKLSVKMCRLAWKKTWSLPLIFLCNLKSNLPNCNSVRKEHRGKGWWQVIFCNKKCSAVYNGLIRSQTIQNKKCCNIWQHRTKEIK